MPKWDVVIARTVEQLAIVTIEAESDEAAHDQVSALLDYDDLDAASAFMKDLAWEDGEADSSEEILDVTPSEETDDGQKGG